MTQLSNRELMSLEENVKLEMNMVRFAQSCSHLLTDPQLRAMCQQISQDHNQDYQSLVRYFNPRNL